MSAVNQDTIIHNYKDNDTISIANKYNDNSATNSVNVPESINISNYYSGTVSGSSSFVEQNGNLHGNHHQELKNTHISRTI